MVLIVILTHRGLDTLEYFNNIAQTVGNYSNDLIGDPSASQVHELQNGFTGPTDTEIMPTQPLNQQYQTGHELSTSKGKILLIYHSITLNSLIIAI